MSGFLPARTNASILSVIGTGTTLLKIVSPTSSVYLDHGHWDLRMLKTPASDSVSPPVIKDWVIFLKFCICPGFRIRACVGPVQNGLVFSESST